ncbi:metallophosphoesterase family protein [Alkalinema sp. FACHB-956]|uniref:metallophosphoesterase family protein n=1 Tax=Alkalinema sp. FACHB-956 TaxID=2692768 RepID=UPI001683C40E|nr:metallophosphoesterase family protein [Alkalinema sp. FACHB-956]MBD2327576.1 serine/threonine protein phosphatase [Alkalinema sp. FACHB-956]
MSQVPRRIVIGDVHGHYDGLMQLFETLAPTTLDEIYFLGDLIDRGPKSAQVVEFVRNHGYGCVLGNHEQMLLESFPQGQVFAPALQAWLQSGGKATMASYENAETLLDHLGWLQTLPTYLDLGDLWLVHAGVHPEIPLQQQTPHQFCWIREEFHTILRPYFPDKLIITGHTITFTFSGVSPGEIVGGNGWLDIDTGAYHPKSGWLTALDTTAQKVYQVNVQTLAVRVRPLAEMLVQIQPESMSRRRSVLVL